VEAVTAVARTARIRGLLAALGEEKFFWRWAAVLLGAVSLLKGLRPPSTWGASQALFNYDHGVIKRGLFGATLGRWFHLELYARFAVASFVLLALLVLLLGCLTWRSHALEVIGNGEPVAVFFASFAMTYLAHLIGYQDIVLGVIAVLLLLVRDVRLRFCAALSLCLCGVLLHEMFLFTLLPVVLFSFVLDALRETQTRMRRAMWVMVLVLGAMSVGVVLKLALERPITPAQMQALYAEESARADFPPQTDVLAILTRSGADNVKLAVSVFHTVPSWWIVIPQSLLVFTPTLILLLIPVTSGLRMQFRGTALRVAMISAGLAVLCPLAMNLFGYDFPRWMVFVVLAAFLILLLLAREAPPTGWTLPAGYRNAAILTIALSMATGETLLDYQGVNGFPFFQVLRHEANWLRHGLPPPR
jgi:hypothetical protein